MHTDQRRVVHAQNYDTLMFRTVFGPTTNVSLEHVAAIQKGHLAVRFDPDLVSCVRRKDGKGGDVQAKLARLGELAQAGAEREEVVSLHRSREVCKRFAHIVDAGALDAEDMAVVGAPSRDQILDAFSAVCGELLEERLGLGLYERSAKNRSEQPVGLLL